MGEQTDAEGAGTPPSGGDDDGSASSRRTTASEPRGWRRELWSFVELFALCGFAFALPLLTVFGAAPEQFAFRGALPSHLVAFGIVITVLPAFGLWAFEAVWSLAGTTARRMVHAALLAALAALAAVQAIRPVALGPLLVLAGVIAFAVAGYAFWRWTAVRTWARFVAVAPALYLVFFLAFSPASSLLRDTGVVDAQIDSPAPVVMLTLDELPLTSLLTVDGTIDEELYPNFAELAADSHWFRNTTAVSNVTTFAVPAIVSGQFPPDGSSPVAADHPETLFTLLGGTYDLRVQEVITRLCPTSLCPITQEGRPPVLRGLFSDAKRVMAHRVSPSEGSEDPVAGFHDPDAEVPSHSGSEPGRLEALIEGLVDSDPETFHYAHLLLPHIPFTWLPSGSSYDSPNPDIGRVVEKNEWNDQQWPPVLGRQRHVLQLQYLDRLLGELFEALRDEGLYDDALIVVVSDHGTSFDAGRPIRAGAGQDFDRALRTDVLSVPFFLKEPGQEVGRVHDTNVLTVDVLPTVADVLDIEVPFDVDGRSALGDPRTTTEKTYYAFDHRPTPKVHRGPLTYDGAETWPSVRERSIGAFLPEVGDPLRVWRVGPAPELVGQQATDLPAERLRAVDGSIEPFGDGALALVRGHPDPGEVEVGTPIAIAVDGVIGATVPVYLEDGRPAIAGMVPEWYFDDRDPEIELYVIR